MTKTKKPKPAKQGHGKAELADPPVAGQFTLKQQRFIDCYAGDIKEAAEKAGISYVYGRRLCTKSYILEAIKNRQDTEVRPKDIADRQERQAFWTECLRFDIRKLCDDEGNLQSPQLMDDCSARLIQSIKSTETITRAGKDETTVKRTLEYKMPDRLKASELLGKSEADFTENLAHKFPEGCGVMLLNKPVDSDEWKRQSEQHHGNSDSN